MKAYYKDIYKEISKTKGRFISIMLIVAIGVAFFTGVSSSSPMMQENINDYYEEYSFRDFEIISTLGLVDDDLNAISELDSVEHVVGQKTQEAVITLNNEQIAIMLRSIPEEDSVNNYKVLEGRLPEANNEIVVQVAKFGEGAVKVGDTITIDNPNTDLSEVLETTTFEVVGLVNNVNDISLELGNSSLANGKITAVFGVDPSLFKSDIYTSALVSLNETSNYNRFSDEYLAYLESEQSTFEDLGDVQVEKRREEIYNEVMEQVNAAKAELAQQKAEVSAKFNEGYMQIDNAIIELNKGLDALEAGKDTAFTAYNDALIEIDNKIAETETALDSLNELAASWPTTKAELDKKIVEINEQISIIEAQLADETTPNKDELQAQLVALQASLAAINEQITKAEASIASIPTLESALAALAEGKVTAKTEYDKAVGEIDTKINEINVAIVELQDQRVVLAEQEEEANKQFLEAEQEIINQEAKLDELGDAKWFVLTPEQNYSYMDYKNATIQMASIAQIFPLFFILVAMLVCSTTMSRMVEEQRGFIGTMKALGYQNGKIAAKYLFYAVSASLVGSILGSIIGITLFPMIIYTAWQMMFNVPDPVIFIDYPLIIQAILIFVVVISVVTYLSAYSALKEVPSSLMRPKAPKAAKRILLERIGFIWKRLSFSEKVSARNIFRYKKRFFMSVVGIAGCFALLLAGFGIRDSISGIVNQQFEEIIEYQGEIKFDPNISEELKDDLLAEINSIEGVEETLATDLQQVIINMNNKDQGANLIVLNSDEELQDFFNLEDVYGNEIGMVENGVIISNKIAKSLDLKVNDTFEVEYDDLTYELKVGAIFNNYIGHYVILNDAQYQSALKQAPKDNGILFKIEDGFDQEEVARQINDLNNISSLNLYERIATSFGNTINSLNIVVLVLIISAGLLAFVVLYNLTTVNVSERTREIATIKVLGFYQKEVEAYVFRENIVLTFIGCFVGVFLGIALHRYIMTIVEQDMVIFGKEIYWYSYLLSVIITFFFAFLVNYKMKKPLKNIEMVESLKSVE